MISNIKKLQEFLNRGIGYLQRKQLAKSKQNFTLAAGHLESIISDLYKDTKVKNTKKGNK